MKRPAVSLRLYLPLVALLLAAACPLDKATYVLRKSGRDWLRIGSDPNGEMILRFTLGTGVESISLPQVIDRIQIDRLDERGQRVDPRSDEAPAFIRIKGLHRISDAPDGEWRLLRCATN